MKKRKLSVVTTFSGIGMQERGLFNSPCFDVKIVATSDIDKDAILSYAAIHCGLTLDMVKNYDNYPFKEIMIQELIDRNIGYDFQKKKPFDWRKVGNRKDDTVLKKYWLAMHLANNIGDISLVKRLPKADLLSFSFPCTDISVAGEQKGVSYDDWKNGTSTRSGLVWEIVRLLKVAKENNELFDYLLLENVSALLSKKFIHEFEFLNKLIDDIGYNVYFQEINGKNTGVPQNRPRVFAVYIRKDIDTQKFEFPKPFDVGLRLKDILEDEVEDKYYLSQQIQDRFQLTDPDFIHNVIGTTKPDYRKIGQRDQVYQTNGIMGSLVATDYKQPKQILVKESPNKCHMVGIVDIKGMDAIKRVYSEDGIAPTLTTMQGGHRQPKVIREIANGNKLLNMVIAENEIKDKECCDMTINEPHIRDIANCIPARYDCGVAVNYKQFGTAVIEKEPENDTQDHYYIRKLTPKECFILMGLSKEDCQKCYDVGESDASLYKQAGNGIITNCIELIAEHLYKAQYNNKFKCTDESYK